MIRFRCEHCRQWLTIAETRAGETGKCPLCRQTTHVPQAGETPPSAEADPAGRSHPASRPPAPGDVPLELVRAPSGPDKHADQKVAFYCELQGPPHPVSGLGIPHAPKAVLPPRARLTDVLLYPMNFDGLAATVILALGFGAVRLFPILFQTPWNDGEMLLMVVTYLLLGAWCTGVYFAFCVFDTTKGGTRAPAVLPAYPYAGGDLSPLLLMGAVAVGLGPAAICWFFLGGMSLYFWLLGLVGAFPLPMLLLACTLLSSAEAFDLKSVVRWVWTTRSPYVGLIVRLVPLLALAVALHLDSWYWDLPQVFFYAADLYLLWIAGHLLGRFYLRQKDKLGWGV